jgi:hypothetical protein
MQLGNHIMSKTTTNPIMDIIMDWNLLILCEHEFIHHHCTSWFLQLWNFLKKKKYCCYTCLHHALQLYKLHHIQDYLIIYYLLYHFES